MTDCLASLESSIVGCLVTSAVNESQYVRDFNKLVEELQNGKVNLTRTIESVEGRVDRSNKQQIKTDIVVHNWLERAKIEKDGAEELLGKASRYKSCFGHCPNWICRYHLGKKVAERKGHVETCNDEGKGYIEIEHVAPLSSLPDFPSEDFFKFDSRRFAYEELMKAVKDDEVCMIGLHGMPGCGKTMLAEELRKTAKHLFDQVLLVAVSSTVDVLSIQDKIASALSFKFPEHEGDERERGRRLCAKLIEEERILVILDDVWAKLDLGAIGIPSSVNHKGCKVLITTRDGDVCAQMDCQRMIQVSILTDGEAWALFQKHAHIFEGTPHTSNSLGLARQISDECKGLPVAVAAVAGTLKGKAEDDWKVALNRLKSSKPVDIEKGLQNPYKCLELSYVNLDSEEAKSLFLLCSVFPEDCEIRVEDLTRFAIELGLVGEVRLYERARNEVSAAKNKLLRSCLLLDAGEGKIVKMHDLVRDVAHWIAKNENKVIKCEYKKFVTVEDSSLRYLWCRGFPNELHFSNLDFLSIDIYWSVNASREIFKGMENLRVLFINNRWILRMRRRLKLSFKWLTNLRCLVLEGWGFDDISFVGDLKKLESLTLRHCSFYKLPAVENLPDIVVAQPTNLRLLDLSKCYMDSSLFEAIGRHPKLEELYIHEFGSKWNVSGVSTAELLNKFSVPQALQRYQIQLGTHYKDHQEEFLSGPRTLWVSWFDTSNAAVKDLAKKAELLFIANIQGGAKSIIPDIFQIEDVTIYGWLKLWICDSKDIECLVDTGNHLSKVGTPFSKMMKLRIERLDHLGALYHGRLPPNGPFEKLEQLYLSHCPKLISLFKLAIAQSLSLLEKLEISDCDGLKHILADDEKEEISIETDAHKLLFPKLKWLSVEKCNKLEYIIPVTFAQGLLQLESLKIENVGLEMKYVFDQCTLGDPNQNELSIKLPALQELQFANMPNIIGIFPKNCYPTWPSLRRFDLHNCPNFAIMSINSCMAGSKAGKQCGNRATITKDDYHHNQIINEDSDLTLQNIKEVRVDNCESEVIFDLAGLPIDGKQYTLTTCLQKLYLENLPQLRHVFKGVIQSMSLQNLQQMEVSGCRKLKCIFSTCIAGGIPHLKELRISHCDQLYQIFEDEECQHFPNPESTSKPSAPLVTNYNSGSCIACMFAAFSRGKLAFCRKKYLWRSSKAQRTSCKSPLTLEKIQSKQAINLSSLRRLTLESCPRLVSLFTASTARTLTSLEEMRIVECHGLRYVVSYERAYKNKEETIQEDHDSCSTVSMFPRLKEISVKNCNSLEYIFHVSFAQGLLELKDIEIGQTPQLGYVFGQSTIDRNIHDDAHSSHQYQNKLQIELPVLEKISLESIPKMISICPENYYAKCSSLRRLFLVDVGLSTLCINNLMVDSRATHSNQSSTKDIEAARQQMLGTVNKIKGIFHLEGLPINGQEVTSRLEELSLINLPEMSYIWTGAKHFVSLQHLYKLHIWRCPKLKAIFSSSVLRSLPLLKILEVTECEKLEQIIEEDEQNENVSNHRSPKVCFPQLKLLLVKHCNNLKCLFDASTSHKFPELEYVIVIQVSRLVQVLEGGPGVREERVEVLLPKLKHVMLVQLPHLENIFQGIEIQTPTNLLVFVHNCQKLSLASTTTAEDMLQNFISDDDEQINFYLQRDLDYIRDIIAKDTANKDPIPEIASQLHMSPEVQAASGSEQVSDSNQSMPGNLAGSVHEHNQIESGATQSASYELHLTRSTEETETNSIGKDPASTKPTTPTSSSEPKPSPTSLATPLHKIPSHKLVDQESASEPGFAGKQHALGETIVTNEVAQRNEGVKKEFVGKVSISETPAISTSLTDSELELVDGQSMGEPCLMNQQNILGKTESNIEIPQSTEDTVKESIQEASTPEEAMKATLSPGVYKDKGVSLGGVVATHMGSSGGDMIVQDSHVVEQSDKPNEGKTRASPCQRIQHGNDDDDDSIPNGHKEVEIGFFSNDSSIEAPPGASADTQRSHALMLTELGAFKHFVDLDDAQTGLLAEAIAVYPHLWNVCDKFTERFQAWRLKTLADMLLFLRNECAFSVTPEREKKFHRLCNEAVQLGFERSWVDEMRKRVKVKDPRVDHAQTRLSELTQELVKIKDEINNLNDFVDSQKKCFDFL